MHSCLAGHGLVCAQKKLIQVIHISTSFGLKAGSCSKELESRLGSWPSIT